MTWGGVREACYWGLKAASKNSSHAISEQRLTCEAKWEREMDKESPLSRYGLEGGRQEKHWGGVGWGGGGGGGGVWVFWGGGGGGGGDLGGVGLGVGGGEYFPILKFF